MRFANPWWLILVPVVVALLLYRHRRSQRPAVLYSSIESLRELPRTFAQRFKRLLPFIEGAGLVLFALAMSRPQAGLEESVVVSQGVAIQIVVDRSGSMKSDDLDPDPGDRTTVTRLDIVKGVVRDFVDEGGELPGRPQDVIGLVSFAGYVQVHCPMTLDHTAFLALADGLQLVPREAGQEAQMTAIGDALVTAVNRIKEIPAASKVVVLLSDGSSNIGAASPKAGAELAKTHGVKVYTIGIGSSYDDVDPAAMQEVADITGGRFFDARNASGLLRVYREIDELERVELPPVLFTQWRELYVSVLLAGAGLLLIHQLLSHTRFRSLP